MAAIRSTGALDYARGRAREEADAGLAALASLPESEHRAALGAIAEHSLDRDR